MLKDKVKTVPLLKVGTDKSIYFNLSTHRLFIQEFVGPFIEKSGESKLQSNIWRISMVGGMLILPLLAKQFQILPFLPIYLMVLLIFGVGWFIGFILNILLVEKSKGKRTIKEFKKEEIQTILKNSSNLRLLECTQITFFVGYTVFFLYSTLLDNLSSKNGILIFLVGFLTSLMHYSVHPFAQRKAYRILKKQLKEGKYDE